MEEMRMFLALLCQAKAQVEYVHGHREWIGDAEYRLTSEIVEALGRASEMAMDNIEEMEASLRGDR